MNAIEYQRLREIFIAACELSEDDRPMWLDQVCDGHPSLRIKVERLLQEDARKQTGLSTEFQNGASSLDNSTIESGSGSIPDRIGRYRIVAKIADGGMGSVYRAEQDSPRRTVAIKVVRPELATPAMLKRISYEAEVLGLLQHPGIARIYEAGTTETDNGPLPFFAMEFVQGEPILEYADSHQLDLSCRLELMARVCEAVHHAHQKGVIHRDLKPSNILVQPSPSGHAQPDCGQPKILDFGVARTTDIDVHMTTLRTDLGQLIGTIPYMSPEQAQGDPSGIDTRSDVYTLGVVAYQLVAGRLPHHLDYNSPLQVIQAIREQPPSRLSSLNPYCRGDVDTIVHKALAKQKCRRYQSATDLANDLRRFIGNQPIEARPPSATYQLAKFARRNRHLVTAMSVAFILLLLAIGGTSFGMMRAHHRGKLATANEVAADHAREEAEAMNEFLTRMFSAVRPRELGRDVRVLDVLDEAARTVSSSFSREPHAEARIRYTIGCTYTHLGEEEKAIEQLSHTRSLLDESDPYYILATHALGATLRINGNLAESEPLLAEAMERAQHHYGPQHIRVEEIRFDLASLYRRQERWDEAERMLRGIAAYTSPRVDEEKELALNAMALLAVIHRQQGRYDEAISLTQEALRLRQQYYEPTHPEILASLRSLSTLHAHMGDYDEAVSIAMDVFRLDCSSLGYGSMETGTNLHNLGLYCLKQGRAEDALAYLVVSRQMGLKYRAGDYVSRVAELIALSSAYRSLDRQEYAEDLLSHTVQFAHSTLGAIHSRTLNAKLRLAQVYLDEGRSLDAEQLLSGTIAISTLPDGHIVMMRLLSAYTDSLAAIGELEEAACVSRRAHKQWEATVGADHPSTIAAKARLAELLNTVPGGP